MRCSAELEPVAFLMALLLTSVHSNCTSIYNCTVDRAPSHGDLWLLPGNDSVRLVMIYMGPDGTDDPKMWGTLNGKNNNEYVAVTLCHQLGYMFYHNIINRLPAEGYNNGRVWLSDINCPKDHRKHILRCKSTFHNPSEKNPDHTGDIHLSCSFPLMNNTGSAYIGQGALLPPLVEVPENKCSRSVSYGAAFFKHNKVWKYIRQRNSPAISMLTLNDTDTICREIGFTHSVRNSVMTVGQTDDGYDDFNKFGFIFSDEFNCPASRQCIGCCFDLSGGGNGHTGNYNDSTAFVLRCSFYFPVNSIPPVTGGYEEICKDVEESVCLSSLGASDTSNFELPFEIVVPTLGTLLVVAVLVLVVVALRLWWRLAQGDYIQVQVDEDAGGEHGQHQHQ